MKYKVLTLLILLLIPLNASAQEFMEYNCKRDDSNYTCEVYGNYNESINAIDFKIEFPSYVQSSEFILDDGTFGSADNNWVSIIFENVTQGRFKLGTIKLSSTKELDTNDIKIKELKVIDELLNEKVIELKYDNVKSRKSIIKNIIICGTIIIGIMILSIAIKRGVNKK